MEEEVVEEEVVEEEVVEEVVRRRLRRHGRDSTDLIVMM